MENEYEDITKNFTNKKIVIVKPKTNLRINGVITSVVKSKYGRTYYYVKPDHPSLSKYTICIPVPK